MQMDNFIEILNMLRVKQWLKNLLVFFPIIVVPFELTIFMLIDLISTFFLFSFISSIIYIANDWADKHADAKHPEKKIRPFASGKLSGIYAITGIFFLCLSIIILVSINNFSVYLLSLLLIYFIQNLAYNFFLKEVSIIEFLSVSSGYPYRVLGGGLAVGLIPSYWILITIFLAAIFVISLKRKHDIKLLLDKDSLRQSFKSYSLAFFDKIISISASAVVVSYLLFTLSDYAKEKFVNPLLPISSLPLIYCILRYLQISENQKTSHDPVSIITKDIGLKVGIIITVVFVCISNFYFGTL